MSKNLSKTKTNISTLFFGIILCAILVFVTGSKFIKDGDFFTETRFNQIVRYIDYVLFYDRETISSHASTEDDVNSIPVLLYHGIVKNPDRFNISVKTFEEQMFALKKAGYQTIRIDDYIAFKERKKVLPPKSFLLTFDDGRVDSYVMADPLLKALGYSAVMYVATESSLSDENERNGTYYLASKKIQTMVDSGRWEIGSHGKQETGGIVDVTSDGKRGQFLSNKMWLVDEGRLENDEEFHTRLEREIVDSKSILEKRFGISVRSFSYPFGDYGNESVNNPNAIETVRELIEQTYSVAFRQVWFEDGLVTLNYPNEDRFLSKRIEVLPDWSGQQLIDFLAQKTDKLLPYSDSFEGDLGWKKTWGVLYYSDKAMILKSHASTTGAAVFLDGAGMWKNYFFKTQATLKKGESVSLIARYIDGNNYVTCSYLGTSLSVVQYLMGDRKVLTSARIPETTYIDTEHTLGVWVNGDKVNCYLDGTVLSSAANINSSLAQGGIGFKVWDEQLDNSEGHFTDVSVVAITKEERGAFFALPEFPNRK